jgi:hypothetical protein
MTTIDIEDKPAISEPVDHCVGNDLTMVCMPLHTLQERHIVFHHLPALRFFGYIPLKSACSEGTQIKIKLNNIINK